MARVHPLLIGLLAAFALEPVLRAGLTAADYRWLLEDGGAPVRQGWAALASVLYGVPVPGEPLLGARLEAVVLVALLALGVRAFLLRLTMPWIGAVQAALAGVTAAGLVALHPLIPALVAGLPGHADLLGASALTWASALYLRGRQERDGAASLGAFALLVACGFATRYLALGFVLFAGAEYASARRHRSRLRRLRTSATAAAGAALALHLAPLLGVGPDSGAGAASDLGLAGVEGLGWLLLPPAGALGMFGVWLAAAMAFFAVQPVFRAARHAPRLWGALFAGWVVALIAGLATPVLDGAPPRLDRAGPWLGAVVALAAGMGLAASALRGGRGVLLRVGLLVAAAVLGRGNALALGEAGRAAARLHQEMSPAGPRRMLVLALDPPALGVEAAGADLAWLRHPEVDGRPAEGAFDPRRTAATSRAGFLVFARTAAFATWRADGLDVLLPREATGERRRVTVPAAWAAPGVRSWRGALTQRFEPELDPLEIAALRVRAEAGQDPREISTLAWEGRSPEASGILEGIVRPQGGELVALFDLSSSLAWRLAGPVRSLVLERAVEPILQGELLERLPAPESPVAPEIVGEDWVFSPWTGLEDSGAPTLLVLELSDLDCLEVPLLLEEGRWIARGVEAFAARARAQDTTVRWVLEYRVGGRVLSRAEGHLP